MADMLFVKSHVNVINAVHHQSNLNERLIISKALLVILCASVQKVIASTRC